MQLRLPKSKDGEKRRKRPPIVSTADAPPCGICEKQISRYTCPSCNLPYCSLACFRSPDHAACAESFQRATLAQDLQGDPQHADGEKNRMLEMLKKFEEQQRELEELEREEAKGDEDELDQSPEAVARRKQREELEKRLEGVDLDALPPDQLLSYLSPEQQAAFEATLQDPNQLNKLVEEQFEGDEPWWVEEEELKMLKEMRETSRRAAEEAGGEVDGPTSDEEEDEDLDVRPPVLLDEQLPPLRVGPDGKPLVSPKLLHNVVAVLFAYAFTLRTFSLPSFSSLPEKSTERTTAIQVLSQLLPFLVERSTSAFDHLEAAVESVVAQEQQGMPSPLVGLLLHDVSTILRPTPVAAISPSSSPLASHALALALHALSDLYHLFALALSSSPPAPKHATSQSGGAGPTITRPLIARPSGAAPLSKQQRTQCALASAKLLFYAAVLAAPEAGGAGVVGACRGLSEEAEEAARGREREEEERRGRVERAKQEIGRRKERAEEEVVKVEKREEAKGPKIVEL
ncbi:hypothetical protein JCM10449v2_005358 [Rhodotorula kratochvilovae]